MKNIVMQLIQKDIMKIIGNVLKKDAFVTGHGLDMHIK